MAAKALLVLNADRPGLRPVGLASTGPPPGFTGPVAGDTVLSTDTRWQLLEGTLVTFNHPSYVSQPVGYFDRLEVNAKREIIVYLGNNAAVDIYLGDTEQLGTLYQFRTLDSDAVVYQQAVTVEKDSGNQQNRLIGTLQSPQLTAGVYRLRGIVIPNASRYCVFDKFVIR